MRSKPSPFLLAVAIVALVAASCGVSRDADVAATTAPTTVTTASPSSTLAIPIVEYTAPDFTGIETAATLNFDDGTSTEIAISEVADVVNQLDRNPEAVVLLFPQGLPATFDLDVLSSIIQIRILDKGIVDENTVVPNGAIDAELANLYAQIDGIVAANEDPEGDRATIEAGVSEYLDLLAERQVKQDAYTSEFGGTLVPCTRHILVDTEAEADTAVQRLVEGEDFAELAAELSTGPSGPNGGDLGCSDPGGFVTEFRDAVIGATEGEVTGPVETQFGWHVILVYGSDTPSDPALAQQLAQQSAFEAYTDLQARTVILVDSAIGEWDPVATRVTR